MSRPTRSLSVAAAATVIVAIIAVAYFYTHYYSFSGLLSGEPRRPQSELPVTYNLGWWAHQDSLKIDSFKVSIVQSKLSLFNSRSLISYSITGHIRFASPWLPSISQVHVSERMNKEHSPIFDRIIEITPVVQVSESNKKNGVNNFRFTNEMAINSNHWGMNRIKFICLNKEQIVELAQHK